MSYGVIYKIVCKINNKIYIGQTKARLRKRWKDHVYYAYKRNGKSHLANAVRLYGEENFEITVIEECESKEELDNRETYWIKELDTLNSGYNLNIGGNAPIWSQEAKDKFSKNHPLRGKSGTEHPAYGNKHTEESKKIIAESSKGRPVSKETRKKLSEINSGSNNPHYGKKQSDETKNKKAETLAKNGGHPNKGKKLSIDQKEKFSMKGKKHSQETKEKMSQVHKGKKLTEEHKANLRRPKSEQGRENIAKAMQRRRKDYSGEQ